MPDELNTPSHRWYQKRYNIPLPKEDFSRDFIYASGISKIDAWIDLLAGRDYSILGFEPLFVADFDDENYRVQGATTPAFSDAITHTRASTATYVDSDGVLQTAASGVPRVGHHVWNGSAWVNEGLLVESEARTNLLTYSQDFTNEFWLKSLTEISSNAITSPDGQENASKLYETLSSGVHQIYTTISLISGTTYCYSFFAKAAEYSAFHTRSAYIASGNWIGLNVDLSAKTVTVVEGASNTSTTVSFGIEEFEDGWFRVHHAWSTASNETAGDTLIGLTDGTARSANVGTATYAGDGTSGIYIYGAQLEVGPTPSSYIPTSGATVTRAADVLTVPAANLPWPAPVVIGPELVTNGTFDADTTGWTLLSTGDVSVVSGEVEVTLNPTAATTAGLYQAFSTVAGKVYQVTGTLRNLTANDVRLRAIDGNTFISPILAETEAVSSTSPTSVSAVFTALSSQTSVYLRIFGADGETGYFDNISVREINPLAVSIQMDGRVTYADTDSGNQVRWFQWGTGADPTIAGYIRTTSGRTGDPTWVQIDAVSTSIDGSDTAYAPGIFVPFNVASRHGSTFLNGAVDGTALTANTTPVALPDLSATDLNLGQIYNGTIRTFRVWANDITDAGLVDVTEPSLEPSLSLIFDGTENSFIVEDWSV